MENHKLRLQGNHNRTDWVWRWSKEAVEWGKKENIFVVKNNRIYTKSYLNVRKKNGKCEWETIEATKPYTTISYIDNQYSNDNAKKELDCIFKNNNKSFEYAKPTSLIKDIIKMISNNKSCLVLDFFAGSGTTGQAVLELNRQDGGERQFILCQLNEITETAPNGIAYDITSERLKRVMTGKSYSGESNFKWLEKNKPLGDNLDVYEIKEVNNFENRKGETPFEVIDETLYGEEKFKTIKEKIEWVVDNFENTQKQLESDKEYKDKMENR